MKMRTMWVSPLYSNVSLRKRNSSVTTFISQGKSSTCTFAQGFLAHFCKTAHRFATFRAVFRRCLTTRYSCELDKCSLHMQISMGLLLFWHIVCNELTVIHSTHVFINQLHLCLYISYAYPLNSLVFPVGQFFPRKLRETPFCLRPLWL